MNLLLDTCALIFTVSQAGKLTEDAKNLISEYQDQIHLSAVSAIELAYLSEKGMMTFNGHWKLWWRELLRKQNWHCLAVSEEIAVESFSLPEFIHRDPWDRIMIATARIHDLTLVTTDHKILAYPHVKTIS